MIRAHIAGVRKALCLIFCLVMISIFLLGCQREKAVPKGAGLMSTCEVLDKLPKDISKTVEVNYQDKIKFLGMTADKLPQNNLKISCYWQPSDDLGSYGRVFVHFVSADNKGLFGSDHDFCEKLQLGELKGKFIKETYTVYIPPSARGQEVSIRTGFYDPVRGGRLKIESSSQGVYLDDDKTRALVDRLKF
jgi:hypothetical protein